MNETLEKEYIFVPLGVSAESHPKFTQSEGIKHSKWLGKPEWLSGQLVCSYEIETPDCIFVGWIEDFRSNY